MTPAQKTPWPVWVQATIIAGAIMLAWANSLRAPFTFDDEIAVSNNATIRQFSTALTPPEHGGTTTGRPLLNFTLAINHAISGDAVWSYHATNILIHAAAALALFGLVRRTLDLSARFGVSSGSVGAALRRDQGESSPERSGRKAPPTPAGRGLLDFEYASLLPFIFALLWALHPLQTESVTSVAQRSESLCGLWYLLMLYGLARGVGSNARPWLFLSGYACLAGMATKEVMVTAPVLALLYDRTFLAGSFAAAWRARRGYYLSLAGTWVLLAVLVLRLGGTRGPTAGLGLGVSAWEYLLTQCDALVIYLRLSVWPHPLVADYGNAIVSSWQAVWWQGLVVLMLLAAAAWALWRRPVLGFFGAWFFLILGPSSSFIPLVSQTIAEHRMYLPLAGVLALLGACAVRGLSGRVVMVGGLVLALAAGLGTWRRNLIYLDEQVLWEDVIGHRPANGRAYNNLGRVEHRQGRLAEAAASFQRSLELDPANPFAQFNLGLVRLQLGRISEAEAPLRAAIGLEPSFFYAHLNLGTVLGRLDRGEEALRHFEIAQRYAPWSAEIHFQWAVVLARLGRPQEAVVHYQECLHLDPQRADAASNWGVLLLGMNAIPEAIARLEAARVLRADLPELHFNLGQAYNARGDQARALAAYAEAVRLDPRHAGARLNLGVALARTGRLPEALGQLEEAARLDPTNPAVHANLGVALGLVGRNAEALAAYRAALQLRPDDAQANYNVGFALLEAGRTGEARGYFENAVRLRPDFPAAREILEQLRGMETPPVGRDR